MPYTEVVPGFGLIRHQFVTGKGSGRAVVLHGVSLAATGSAGDVAGEAATHWAPVMGELSIDLQYVETDAIINKAGVLSEARDATHTTFGSKSGQQGPSNAAYLVRKQTTAIGRHFRGRMYLPGVYMGSLNDDGNTVKSAQMTSIQGVLTTYFNSLTPGTFIGGIYILHKLLSVPPTLVAQLTLQNLLASQRRRLRKAPHH